MARVVARLPPSLLRRPLRVLRPQDAAGVYRHPRPEFARLARSGVLHRLADGYYAVVPDDQIGRPWLPELESVAVGVAAADQGVDAVALMGLSAARLHGAVPRALGVAVVAVTGHRRTLRLTDRDATVVFARRKIGTLDVERRATELGHCWLTTIEQTLLDLAARPDLGELPHEADAAVRALLPRVDRRLLTELATAQRRRATLNAALFKAHGPTNQVPTGNLFARSPDEADWRRELSGQTLLEVTAREALGAVREAWCPTTSE